MNWTTQFGVYFVYVAGGNLLLARMATRKAKPDGQYCISSDSVLEFISSQPAADLPGM